MKIGVFSMGPIFPKAVHGGSQKTLQTVMYHLGSLGHLCTIYCTRRDDNDKEFNLSKNVQVKPVLRYKQTYPEPHYTAPYYLTDVILSLKDAVETNDVFYIHDGELNFQFLYSDIPTVIAFQDFVYPDTLASAFSFQRDHLIVTSEYVRDCVLQTFSQFRDVSDRISVVPNGFNVDVFSRCDSTRLRQELNLSENDIPILYPHRPDPRKGIYEAIQVISRLKQYLHPENFKRLRLLVPVWVDSKVTQNSDHIYQSIYGEVSRYATELGMPDLLVFHEWMPVSRMPEYYSLGQATLCVGNFVEAFGNASIESELCGTPAIISRVGAQRYILPEEIAYKVDYKDHETAAQMLAKVLSQNKPVHTEDIRSYIRQHFDEQLMIEGYARELTSVSKQPMLQEKNHITWNLDDQLTTPAWCSLTSSGYYNDYLYDYVQDADLSRVVKQLTFPLSVGELFQNGVTEEQARNWVREGLLARYPSDMPTFTRNSIVGHGQRVDVGDMK